MSNVNLFDPAYLNKRFLDLNGDINQNLAGPAYTGGQPAVPDDLKPGLVNQDGNLNSSLTNDGLLKRGLCRDQPAWDAQREAIYPPA